MGRVALLLSTLIAALALESCAVSLSSQPAPAKLTSGFWFWEGSAVDPTQESEPLDVLFVQVGTIRQDRLSVPGTPDATGRWSAWARLHENLPQAREYWIAFRYERQGVPALEAAPIIGREVSRLEAEARERQVRIRGVQLDIDTPTGALSQYAAFLDAVRKSLPAAFELSITALLDWFRPGTEIGRVIRAVDEFVPQFYDINAQTYRHAAIAAPVDAARWGPIFNQFGKRFRIGISSFGRTSLIPRSQPGNHASLGLAYFFSDLRPIDITVNPAFTLETSRNKADELVLTYRTSQAVKLGYNRIFSARVEHPGPDERARSAGAVAPAIHRPESPLSRPGRHIEALEIPRGRGPGEMTRTAHLGCALRLRRRPRSFRAPGPILRYSRARRLRDSARHQPALGKRFGQTERTFPSGWSGRGDLRSHKDSAGRSRRNAALK